MTLAKPDKGDEILSIARNAEKDEADQETDGASSDQGEVIAQAAPLAAQEQPIATTGTGESAPADSGSEDDGE